MVDPFLWRDASCRGAFVRRRSPRFRTSALVLLCTLSSFPAYAETARDEIISNQLSRHLAITSALAEASNRFRLPVHWLRAVMRAESGGDTKSVSRKGAIGLMQLMPATYAELRTRYGLGADPFNPHDNIQAGAAYLRELLDQYGESGFLAAYNAGPGRYEEHLRGRALPAETTDYVQSITSALSLGGNSVAPYPASSGKRASLIIVAITESKAQDNKRPRHSVDTALGAEGSTHHSLIPARPDARLFAVHLQATSGPNASSPAALARASDLFAVRRLSRASR